MQAACFLYMWRVANGLEPSLNVFVAGVEGAGHHGAVFAFLGPLLDRSLGHVLVTETPAYKSTNASNCAHTAVVGWESFPAGHRVSELSRLSLLYRNKSCFGGDAWPTTWRCSAKVSCLRCSGVVPSYVDVVDRFDESDRLALVPFRAQFGLKVIFLMRDFESAVSSHANWDGGPVGHAIVMAAHLTLLARDAEGLPPDAWRVLWYETLEKSEGFITAAVGTFEFLASACVGPARIREIARLVRRDSWLRPSKAHKAKATTLTPQLQIIRALDDAVSANWSIFNDPRYQLVPGHTDTLVAKTRRSTTPLYDNSTLAALLYGSSAPCAPMDVQLCRRQKSRPPTYPPHTQRLCSPPEQ